MNMENRDPDREMGPLERKVIKMLYPTAVQLARLSGDDQQVAHLERERDSVARQEERAA